MDDKLLLRAKYHLKVSRYSRSSADNLLTMYLNNGNGDLRGYLCTQSDSRGPQVPLVAITLGLIEAFIVYGVEENDSQQKSFILNRLNQ